MKKILAIALATTLLMVFTSCHTDGDNTSSDSGSLTSSEVSSAVSSEETVVQKTYFKQSEPVEVAYEAGNPATAPVILTEIPTTWKLTMRTIPGVDFCTMDTMNTYDEVAGEKKTSYDYLQTSGRLIRIHHAVGYSLSEEAEKVASGESDRKLYTQEERKAIADAFVARNADLTQFARQEVEEEDYCRAVEDYLVNKFHYYIPSPFGEWEPGRIILKDLCRVEVDVNIFGEIEYYYYGLREELGEIPVPTLTYDQWVEKVEAEESYQRYLEYEKNGDDPYLTIPQEIFPDEDRTGYYVWAAWYAYSDHGYGGDIIDQEIYCYPLSDYGDYTKLEELLRANEARDYEIEYFE